MTETKNVFCLNVVDSDVDLLREHYAKTLKPALVSPIGGCRTISANDLHLSIGEFDVWKGGCTSGMSVRFDEAPDLFALYLPLTGTMAFKGRTYDHVSVPGSMLLCDFGKVDQVVLGPGRSHVGIGFSKNSLARQLSDLTQEYIDSSFEFTCLFPIDHDNGYLARMCALVGESIDLNPKGELSLSSNRILLQSIMTRLLESVPHRYSRLLKRQQSPAQPRQVKIAVEFMTANASMPITIEDIADASGVTSRSLQLAFQNFKHTTPMGFLRQIRLQRARAEIVADGPERVVVSAVAKRWGFSNVARFSAMYANSFGETPKETLLRKHITTS